MANPRKAPRPSKAKINPRFFLFLSTHRVTKKNVNNFLDGYVRRYPDKNLQPIAADFQEGEITAFKAFAKMGRRLKDPLAQKQLQVLREWTLKAGKDKPWAAKMTDLDQFAKGVTPEQEKQFWGF